MSPDYSTILCSECSYECARWKELAKMAKIERRLMKMLMEDPGQRPIIPGPSLPQTLPERTTLERCGACDQCKALECGMWDSCKGEGTIATRARSKGAGAHTQGPCEGGQRRCVSWAEPPPPQPSSTSSWGTSSIVSEATPDNLASGATPKLLASRWRAIGLQSGTQ